MDGCFFWVGWLGGLMSVWIVGWFDWSANWIIGFECAVDVINGQGEFR